MERLKFNNNLKVSLSSIISKNFAVLYSEFPLFLRWNHFLLPNILADHEQVVFRAKRRAHVKVTLAALDVKSLHGGIKIHKANTHPDHTDDRQLELFTGLFYGRYSIISIRFRRILKNINAIKSQFLGFLEPIHKAHPMLFPSRINHS